MLGFDLVLHGTSAHLHKQLQSSHWVGEVSHEEAHVAEVDAVLVEARLQARRLMLRQGRLLVHRPGHRRNHSADELCGGFLGLCVVDIPVMG